MMTQSIFFGKLSSNWGSCQLPDKSWDIFHFSIKQAGQNLFMHGPPYSLAPLHCFRMGPAQCCTSCVPPAPDTGGTQGPQCCSAPGGLKALPVFCESGRPWMLPFFSLFPLFPFCTSHTPLWEMLGRFGRSRYCFCGDRLKSCDKPVLLGYSCVTFESFDGNFLLAFVFWFLDPCYVDALNFLSIIRQLILLIFCFLQDY